MLLSITNSSWHSPSNAHAYRLLIFKELVSPLFPAETKKWDSVSVRRPCQPLFSLLAAALRQLLFAAQPTILARLADRVNPFFAFCFAAALA
jgi:hypothetical protein